MTAARLPIRASFRYGWETFKKRPWFIIGAGALIFAINFIIPAPGEDDPLVPALALFAISFVLGTFLQAGATNLTLRLHDSVETARLADLWRPEAFLRFLAVTVLATILVVLGLILLIIPGIIIAIAISFATYLTLDRNLAPVASLKESWRITKGNRWRLFLFMLFAVLVNVLGALALLIGLIVSIPVTMIATVHAYRFLADAMGEPAPVTDPGPEVMPDAASIAAA